MILHVRILNAKDLTTILNYSILGPTITTEGTLTKSVVYEGQVFLLKQRGDVYYGEILINDEIHILILTKETLTIQQIDNIINTNLCTLDVPQTDKTLIIEEKGLKFDKGKIDFSLLPSVALEEAAKAFMYGASKYGRFNYKKGLEVSRLIAAALRHIYAYSSGKNIDEESKISHLGHALANIMMIIDLTELNTLIDNRFKSFK